jgi:type IV pilus assembly protein PilA
MKKLKGFTLMELIVVIAIIGVLSAVLVPSWMNYIASSHIKSENSNSRIIFKSAQDVVQDYQFKERKLADANRVVSNAANAGDFYFYWDGHSGTLCDSVGAVLAPADTNFNANFATEVNKVFSQSEQTVYKIYVHNYIVRSVVAGRTNGDMYMGSYPVEQEHRNTAHHLVSTFNMSTID